MQQSTDAPASSGALRSWPAGSPQSRGGPWIRYRASARTKPPFRSTSWRGCIGCRTTWHCPSTQCCWLRTPRCSSALSGEQEVATGYVAEEGAEPLLCRLSTEFDSWRSLLLDVHRVESEVLLHKDFPVDALRRELGLTEPSFETVFDPTGGEGDLAEDTVLWLGISQVGGQLVLRLRYRTDALDADCAARVVGYHLTALALIAADPEAEHRDPEPALRRRARVPARGARRTVPGASGSPGPRAVRRARTDSSGHHRGRARRPPLDLPRAQRPGQPARREPCWREGCNAKGSSRW